LIDFELECLHVIIRYFRSESDSATRDAIASSIREDDCMIDVLDERVHATTIANKRESERVRVSMSNGKRARE
jgi:hypothetical protein